MKFIKNNGINISFSIIVIILASIPLLFLGDMVKSTTVLFLGKCISYAIIAIGLDIIWGYTGILSLGHGLYFALGAYGMAMYLKLQATNGNITDFMKVGGLTELPLIWKPFLSFPLSIIMILVLPTIISGLIGYFIFKNRVKGVYFSIISQALTWAAYSIFIALSPYTNGNVGITEIQSILGSTRGVKNQSNLITLFYIALTILILIYAMSYYLLNTKFGRVLIAIRDGENRTYFSGYNVSKYKNFVYILSAIYAAIAGAIFVNFNGSITPTQMTISFSITMIIWVAVGGRGTLIGAVIGTFLINLCEYNLSSGGTVEIWQYIIGALFTITIIFFKNGIVGLVSDKLGSKHKVKVEKVANVTVVKEVK